MASTLSEEFTLLPLSLPSDAYEILRLNYQVYLSDPLHDSSSPQSKSVFISSGLAGTIALFSKPSIIAAKLVPASNSSKIASYIVWSPPSDPDPRSAEERERDVREEVEGMSEGLDKDLVYNLKMEDKVLGEKYLGEGFKSK